MAAVIDLGGIRMLLNLERARQKMDQLGLDALIASTARHVYYASGFWTRISEWGFQENQASVLIPRDPAIPALYLSALVHVPLSALPADQLRRPAAD